MQPGALLEDLTVARAGIEKLVKLTVGVPKVVAAESFVDTYTDEDIYTMVAGGGEKLRASTWKSHRKLLQDRYRKRDSTDHGFCHGSGTGRKGCN